MELNTAERIMMDGLQAREREIEREYNTPLRADYQMVARLIETRLNLEPGSVGSRYAIDLASHRLVEVNPPQETPETPEVPAAPETPQGDEASPSE